MRKSCERIWEHRAEGKRVSLDFESFFQDTLTQFDTQVDEFSWQRVQDELIGQMSDLLDVDYDVLSLDLNDSDRRRSEERRVGTESVSTCRYRWSRYH